MKKVQSTEQEFTAVLSREGNWFVGYNPETGVASQGKSRSDALKNLKEAVELFLEEDPIGMPEKSEVVAFKARVKTHA